MDYYGNFVQSVLRIWDCLFLEGEVVLFRVAITLVTSQAPALSSARNVDEFLTTFQTVCSSPFASDCHALIRVRMRPQITVAESNG